MVRPLSTITDQSIHFLKSEKGTNANAVRLGGNTKSPSNFDASSGVRSHAQAGRRSICKTPFFSPVFWFVRKATAMAGANSIIKPASEVPTLAEFRNFRFSLRLRIVTRLLC